MRNALTATVVSALSLLVGCGGDDDTSGSTTSTHGTSTDTGSTTDTTTGVGGGTTTGSTTDGGGGAGTGGSAPTNNGFPPHWNDGTSCASEPDVQVWEYAEDTYILRQSLCANFEGPFLYLFLGDDKALLEDTGTGDVDLATVVQVLVDQWAAKKGKTIELVVAHSHGHGDHVGGDGQFAGMPNTTVVPKSTSGVQGFFGIANWPTQLVTFDLGNRVLDVIPIPGHQSAHIAFYDRRHDLLLTGDTLYPGRLYINDWSQYRASTQRLVDFVGAGNPVTWVLGTHIEMTVQPGDDYPMGADQHPNEHVLQLAPASLDELNQAVQAMGATPSLEVHDDFIVYPL